VPGVAFDVAIMPEPSLQIGVAREATDVNVVPLDQLLPYFSRSVSVAFAYA
jgi:hypothetical protein